MNAQAISNSRHQIAVLLGILFLFTITVMVLQVVVIQGFVETTRIQSNSSKLLIHKNILGRTKSTDSSARIHIGSAIKNKSGECVKKITTYQIVYDDGLQQPIFSPNATTVSYISCTKEII